VISLVALSSLRSLLRHPWQILLAVLGIAVGVAVVVGIDLASASSLRGFRLSTQALVGDATHEVRASTGNLDEAWFARLALAHPELAMAPVIEVAALLAQPGTETGPRRALTVFGVDPFSEARLRPWLSDLDGADGTSGSLELLTEPGSALISVDTARELRVAAGDTLRLRIGSRFQQVRLLGLIVPDGERARIALDNLLVLDIASAQELCGMIGRLTRVDLALPEGEAGARAAHELRASLQPPALLHVASLRGRGLEQMSDAFRLNLRALSLLALLVGLFLVYNTMTFSVLQRRELFATLRTLGVTRAEVFRAITAEALWLGVVGTALGLMLGTQLARALLVLITRTMNDLYFVVAVREVHLDAGSLLRAAALGVGATLLGALLPAIEATRERPRLALAVSSLETKWSRLVPRLCAIALLLFALALGLFAWQDAGLLPSFLGLLALVLGFAAISPALTVAIARLGAPILGWRMGMFGRHAARSVESHLSRTAVAVAALALAISATVGMGVMVSSFRSTFLRWLELSLEADVYASAPTLNSGADNSMLDPAFIAAVRAASGVRELTTYRGFRTMAGERPVQAAAITLNAERRKAFEFRDADAQDVWPAFETSQAVIVSESFGYRNGIERGQRLSLATDRGARDFEVLGTYSDFASDQGFVLMSRESYERCFDDRGISSLGIFAAAGVDSDELAARLQGLVPAQQQVQLRSNRVLREASIEVFERTFEITGVLRILSTLVAFIGVLSALLALELERGREIGMLRAQGVTPREVRRLVLAETGMLGTIAGLIAMPLGLALALVLILVINKRSFGWSLVIELDPWVFAAAFALALVSALLAGLWPAWRLSRVPPALALRGD